MKSLPTVALFLLVSLGQTACASEKIFDVRANREVTRAELLVRLETAEEVIVGEKHDTAVIQDAEARLFEEYAARRREPVTFAWEFLNWSEKPRLDAALVDFRSGKNTSTEFLKNYFGEKNPELTYAPIFEAVRLHEAEVLPTNLTRAEKAPVVKDGLGALDPKLLPAGFELGGKDYSDRFAEAIGDHANPGEIANYFAAQCLVDDVAAVHFLEDRRTSSAFVVIGDFHVRYFDGFFRRLEVRRPGRSRLLVQISEASEESDWPAVMNHPKYGALADFLILL